ncbi:MAG: methyltransferase [Deltaproteobacteria bacterium]|nr:methyltransferase [Deltaproteobacteria bacterium]
MFPTASEGFQATSKERIGPYAFFQDETGQRLTGDTVLLSEFIPAIDSGNSIIDLGAGAGALLLLLAWKTEASRIVGVEIDENASALARRNIEENGLSGRVEVINADYRTLPDMFGEGAFNIIVSNPPYGKAGSGRQCAAHERNAARSEVYGALRDLIAVSKHLAGKDGRIFYVFTAARLKEMLRELEDAGLRPARLSFKINAGEKKPKVFLVEAIHALS